MTLILPLTLMMTLTLARHIPLPQVLHIGLSFLWWQFSSEDFLHVQAARVVRVKVRVRVRTNFELGLGLGLGGGSNVQRDRPYMNV